MSGGSEGEPGVALLDANGRAPVQLWPRRSAVGPGRKESGANRGGSDRVRPEAKDVDPGCAKLRGGEEGPACAGSGANAGKPKLQMPNAKVARPTMLTPCMEVMEPKFVESEADMKEPVQPRPVVNKVRPRQHVCCTDNGRPSSARSEVSSGAPRRVKDRVDEESSELAGLGAEMAGPDLVIPKARKIDPGHAKSLIKVVGPSSTVSRTSSERPDWTFLEVEGARPGRTLLRMKRGESMDTESGASGSRPVLVMP